MTKALGNCNYPRWALNRVKIRMNNPAQKKRNRTTQQNNTPKPYITVPYYRGLSESVKKNAATMVYKYTSKEVPPLKTS